MAFWIEERCPAWRVAVADLGSTDPPVYVRHGGEWQPFLDRLSTACAEMALSEVLLRCRQLSDTCDLPAELITTSSGPFQREGPATNDGPVEGVLA